MSTDLIAFSLFTLSSIFIIVNPLVATITFVSLTAQIPAASRNQIAMDATRYAMVILLVFAIGGGAILQLFGISLQAFRIGGGILLFGIGLEMVYGRTTRTKITDKERSESPEAEDIAVMPLATPIISGPGAITTAVVLMNEAVAISLPAALVVVASILGAIGVCYLMMKNSDLITRRVGIRQYRAINRMMGMLLIAIAVQLVITGIQGAFPILETTG